MIESTISFQSSRFINDEFFKRLCDMIQNYNEMHKRVNLYNESIFVNTENVEYGQIQKLYSTHQYLALQTRFRGKTRVIFLGRGGGHEGLWVEDKLPHSKLRIRDRFLEYLRSHIKAYRVSEIILDPNDRILTIPIYKNNMRDLITLFYKGRDLYFSHIHQLDHRHYKIFLSWKKIDNPELLDVDEKKTFDTVLDYYNELGRLPNVKNIDVHSKDLSSLKDHFDSFKTGGVVAVTSKRKKFLKRKKLKIESDLKKVKSWSDLKILVEDPGFKFSGERTEVILGTKFKFETEMNHFNRLNVVYQKIKKMKSGEVILNERLLDCESELLKGKTAISDEYKTPDKVLGPIWTSSSTKREKVKITHKEGIIEYKVDNIRFAIGTSANGNDYLRSQWANKNDFWFHIEGDKSAHLVVKESDISKITSEMLSIFGSALRDNSSSTALQIPFIFTQVKNLKGVKGSPGLVIYKKVKYLTVEYNPEWKAIISSS